MVKVTNRFLAMAMAVGVTTGALGFLAGEGYASGLETMATTRRDAAAPEVDRSPAACPFATTIDDADGHDVPDRSDAQQRLNVQD